jgi:hypothetical protein
VYSGGSALHMFANLDLAAHKASLRNEDIECKPLKRSGGSFDNIPSLHYVKLLCTM